MRAYVDIHIHSSLSPCADNDMTPNNIVNMAWLKGMDIIAVTDHNAVGNCDAVLHCAKERGILAVPGMELETREEVHLVCLFPDIESAVEMQKFVWLQLPDIKNNIHIFGEQLVMDAKDRITGQVERMLMTAADIGVEEVYEKMAELGGVVIPAHVDRPSYSMISNLGFIPEELKIKYLEFSRNCNLTEFLGKNKNLDQYRFLRSSDAHRLEDMMEKEFYMNLEEISIRALFKTLQC